jgi:hypothetical protein
MSRTTTARLLTLAADLAPRERLVLEELVRFRLMSHAQLTAILEEPSNGSTPASAARASRRILAQMTSLGLLARLERRVGGVRAGSQGYIYYLGPAGQRLVAFWQGRGITKGRSRPEPGGRFVRHHLAVAQLYIDVRRAGQDGVLDLLAFDPEPASWRQLVNGFGGHTLLKPDAFLRIGIGAYEDRYFVEVDLGSESRIVIAQKLRGYVSYWHSGAEQQDHGVFPRVLLLTTTEARKSALMEVCERLPAESWSLFTITTLDKALEVLSGQLEREPAL